MSIMFAAMMALGSAAPAQFVLPAVCTDPSTECMQALQYPQRFNGDGSWSTPLDAPFPPPPLNYSRYATEGDLLAIRGLQAENYAKATYPPYSNYIFCAMTGGSPVTPYWSPANAPDQHGYLPSGMGRNYMFTFTTKYGSSGPCDNTNNTTITENAQAPLYCPTGWDGPYGDPNVEAYCYRPKCPCNTHISPIMGNPIDVFEKIKLQREVDYYTDGLLRLEREYRSDGFAISAGGGAPSNSFGPWWRNSYERQLVQVQGSGSALVAQLDRPDGRQFDFTEGTNSYLGGPDSPGTLTRLRDAQNNPIGWSYESAGNEIETYDATGLLTRIDRRDGRFVTIAHDASGHPLSVTDERGRSLQFGYDLQDGYPGQARINSVTLPDGNTVSYDYNYANVISAVHLPGSTTRQYKYDDPNSIFLLTSIIDENGVTYASFTYDANHHPLTTSHAGGVDMYQVVTSQPAAYIDPLGTQHTFTLGNVANATRVTAETKTCAGCATTTQSIDYDGTGNVDWALDFNSNKTTYTYDPQRFVETSRTEAATDATNKRTTTTTWNVNFLVPDQRSVANTNGVTEALTKWTYNTRGQALARCVIDPAVSGALSYTCGSATNAPTGVRQWKYTYCDAVGSGCPVIGLTLSVDGPRTDVSDVTTYTYYQTTDLSGCAILGGACHNLGDLQTVTNAFGQITTNVSYDKNGRVTRMQDANGTYTDMTYHARGWLLTRTVRANANGTPNSSLDATTTFAYDNVGNVTKVTQPDGAYLTYTYDAAHRLTDIADNLNDTIHYALDAAGNRTDETTKDPGLSLKREISRQYDQLSRLTHLQNAAFQDVQKYLNPLDAPPSGITYIDGYDGNGNAIYSVDGATPTPVGTEQQYDPLNRLVKTLQDHAGTGATHDTTTRYAYDTRDNLRSVIDPDNLATNYIYDGLNNLTDLNSPDTGHTGYTPDAAGNRKTQTDARGVTSTYSYDALNRLTSISYPTTTLNVNYAYDQVAGGCSNIGRLTTITDSSGSTTYCYDQRVNVLKKTQIVNPDTNFGAVTTWAYSLADRVTNMTYPSGLQLTYVRNSIGQVAQITYKTSSAATSVTLISAASYYPFGPLNVLTYGNGGTLTRSYDQDYAIDKIVGSGANPLVLDATVDVLGNLINASSTVGANPPTLQYLYDPLYRLTDVQNSSGMSVAAFSYDNTGDRVSKTPLGQATKRYTYTPGTHHLASVGAANRAYDANGNTTSDGVHSYTFDNSNRLTSASGGSAPATYQFNGRGERVKKNTSLDFAYDESGRLITEYGIYQPPPPPPCDPETQVCTSSVPSSGPRGAAALTPGTASIPGPNPGGTPAVTPGTDYIYLDSLPIAVVQWGLSRVQCLTCGPSYTPTLYYVQADQLGTPRQVIQPGATTATDTTVWKWDYFANNSAFGENTPSVQTLTFNLRFPGQYFDAETGLSYNYARDYEPATGRYIESDPIGLNGGSSTYGYVGGSPLRFRDSLGLCKVEARCNLLGAGPILGKNFSHCFLVVTDPSGGSTFFRGGPSGNGSLVAASSNSHGGIGAEGDSGYGNIVTNSGPYLPGTVDWPTSSTPQTGSKTYINNDKPCTCIKNQINNALQDIQNANTPYNPLSTNSNSTAFQALQSIGVTPGIAPAPAPGWGIPLPDGGGGNAGGQCCDQ